jgi:hypothetical protein
MSLLCKPESFQKQSVVLGGNKFETEVRTWQWLRVTADVPDEMSWLASVDSNFSVPFAVGVAIWLEASRFEAPRFDVPRFDVPRFDVPRFGVPI